MKKTVWEKTKEKCGECGKNLYKIKNDLSNYRCHSESIDCFPGDINKFQERIGKRMNENKTRLRNK